MDPVEMHTNSLIPNLFAFLILLSPGCGQGGNDPADAPQPCVAPCFRTHMAEAIELNLDRMPLYADLTDGVSRPISASLILGELASLAVSDAVDGAARPYQAEGVCIVCDDFVSMETVPAFRETFEFDPLPISEFEPLDPARLVDLILDTYACGGFEGLSDALEAEIEELEAFPNFHCMVRHLLESILRMSNLAPLHDREATRLGLPSTRDLSWSLVRMHTLVFAAAVEVDATAAPLQAEGLPIICRDVPPIPPLP